MSSDRPAIRAENLGKVYTVFARPLDRLKQLLMGKRRQYGRQLTALSEVTFSLPRGQVLGVVGNNGAGKSTLLQLLCRTLTPTHGSLEVNGRVAALLELGAGFNPEFSGRENIFLNAAVLGLSAAEIAARYDDIVNFSGIADFIDQPVKTYSSGMYVRLAFSIATAVDPDILVIDEALSVGDGAFARKSFDRIMALREAGTTILFCSHSMYHIEAICDQAIWLERGKMMMHDIPARVTAAYRQKMAADERTDSAATASLPAAISPDRLLLPLPKGEGRLLDLVFTVDAVSGRRLCARAGRSTFTVDVKFQIDPELPRPTIAYSLETTAGVSVSSGSTLFDGVALAVDAQGVGQVRLSFPQLPLMRDKFRITIYLGCEQLIHVYDHALHCAEIEVSHDGLEQGVVFLPHAWNDGPVVTVPAGEATT